MELKATLRRPTGFSDRTHSESEVTIVSFADGDHQDGGGYGIRRKCLLAHIIHPYGKIDSVPADWLSIAKAPEDAAPLGIEETAPADPRQLIADLADCLQDMTKHYVEVRNDMFGFEANEELEVIAAGKLIAKARDLSPSPTP